MESGRCAPRDPTVDGGRAASRTTPHGLIRLVTTARRGDRAARRTSDVSSAEAKPAYRPDIDGLRAVAVTAVLFYHAFPSALPGGFVGVDVFFVISGFLISTLIWQGLDAGTFSLRRFYGRRVRRLFPVLLAASFGYNVGTVGSHPTQAFYLLPARFWELLLGGLLAYVTSDGPGEVAQRRPLAGHVASLAGVVLLVFTFLHHIPTDRFPGWWAALPVLGSAGRLRRGARRPLPSRLLCRAARQAA